MSKVITRDVSSHRTGNGSNNNSQEVHRNHMENGGSLHSESRPSLKAEDLGKIPNFWELRSYKKTLDRINEGNKGLSIWGKMIQERITIESAYSKDLSSWAEKWSVALNSGTEYGTTKRAMLSQCTEGSELSLIHESVCRTLTDAIQNIKQWQKTQFPKNFVGTIKAHKEFEESFRTAQKPWEKRLMKVNKCKSAFFTACKSLRTSEVALQNAQKDAAVSEEQVRKFESKKEKHGQDVEVAKDKYKAALSDLDDITPKYVEDMRAVFASCQAQEGQRLTFIRDMLLKVRTAVSMQSRPQFTKIYEDYLTVINSANKDGDLNHWSETFGMDMPFDKPVFEGYTEEYRNIGGRKASKHSGNDAAVTLKSIQPSGGRSEVYESEGSVGNGRKGSEVAGVVRESQIADIDDFSDNDERTYEQEIPESKSKVSRSEVDKGIVSRGYDPVPKPPIETEDSRVPSAGRSRASNVSGSTAGTGSPPVKGGVGSEVYYANDVGKINDGASASALPEDLDPESWTNIHGGFVRALYPYQAQENDELTFSAGDKLEKLAGPDEMGWVTARFNGKIGLYPETYCADVPT